MIFFDTNILVYRFHQGEPSKRTIAIERLARHVAEGRALISTQVLQEFYSVVVRKLKPAMPAEGAFAALTQLARLPTVELGRTQVLQAALKSQRHQLSIWDALILEAALAGGADTLLTEDLQHGAAIDGVRIENPFLSAA